LYGTKFEVYTDHHSLQWLMKATTPARLVRWALRLAEYDFTIKYKRGDENSNADALSRLPTVEEIASIKISNEEFKERIKIDQRSDPESHRYYK